MSPELPLEAGPTPSRREELLAEVRKLHWYHPIDLGGGVVTPGDGAPNHEALARHLPEMAGRSVLDIGAWDGLYSFLAESRGAARVVAMDHYAWGVDFEARNAYWRECDERGVIPDPRLDTTEFFRPDELPGRRGFELAHEILASGVEPMLADFGEVGPDEIGRFDVVLFLGVLYHLRDPLGALEKVRRLTGEVAVIESEAVQLSGLEDYGLLDFYAGDEWMGDHSNWFAPTERALLGMCRAAGFSRAETRMGPPPPAPRERPSGLASLARAALGRPEAGVVQRPVHYRILVHAFT